MKEKIFDNERILNLLEELDSELERKVSILLIGGGAMALRGEKDATKDIDIVIMDEDEFKHLIYILEGQGFNKIERFQDIIIDPAYNKMDATMLKDERDYWIDIFLKRICHKFLVHPDVISRSTPFGEFKMISISLMAREDLFLAKSITERIGDLDDMYALFLKGLDEETIINEMDFQTNNTDHIWEAFMVVKLEEMEERYDITVTFKNKILKIAEEKMEAMISKKEDQEE